MGQGSGDDDERYEDTAYFDILFFEDMEYFMVSVKVLFWGGVVSLFISGHTSNAGTLSFSYVAKYPMNQCAMCNYDCPRCCRL